METKELGSLPLTEEYTEADSLLLITEKGAKRIPAGNFNQDSDWNAAEGQPGHVLNRTHWAERSKIDPIFDGDISGWEAISVQEYNAYAVRVTSEFVPLSSMIGATATIVAYDGTEVPMPLSSANTMDAIDVLGAPGTVVLSDGDPIVLSLETDAEISGLAMTAGTWTMCVPGMFHVKTISCLQYFEREVVHKLDKKYLPEGLGNDVFVVTVIDDGNGNVTADKTAVELAEAYKAGKTLQCYHKYEASDLGTMLYLWTDYAEEQVFVFTGDGIITLLEGEVCRIVVEFSGDDVTAELITASSTQTIPTALPNPYPLTINGQTYDGSEAVTVDISSSSPDSGSVEAGGYFTVTITSDENGNLTADKTIEELDEAYQSGKTLMCVNEDASAFLPLAYGIPSTIYVFTGVPASISAEAAKTAMTVFDNTEGSLHIQYTEAEGVTQDAIPTHLPNPNKICFRNALASVTRPIVSEANIAHHYYDGTAYMYVFGIPCPYSLKLTGAVTAEYDGSQEVTVEIPSGINGLPVVSDENNGAFLRVVDGSWTAVSMTNAEEVEF